MSIKSKEEGKTISTTSDPEHLMGKWQKNTKTSHTEAPRGQPCISKWPMEETIECRRHERMESTRGVSFHPIVRGVFPIFFVNFERFYNHFNGF